MKTSLCTAKVLALLLVSFAQNAIALELPSGGSQERPETPQFRPPEFPAYENDLIIGIFNPNDNGSTEIYRSRNESDGYALIATIPAAERHYLDTNLRPNTTFYYKLRAEVDGLYSDFSTVLALTSGHALYAPILSAEAVNSSTIQVTVQDVSYNDLSYDVWRGLGGEGLLLRTISAPDSGVVFTFQDSGLVPNTTYSYRIDVHAKGPGNVFYPGMVTTTATTLSEEPTSPVISGFTLVDPVTDMDIGELTDGIEFQADERLNIRADANADTKSVAFFINGERYWGENEEPYALFGDRRGDYKPGRFKPGEYTVTAIPYSENLHIGIAGDSQTVHFVVTGDNGNGDARLFAEVNVFPNPVVSRASIEVAGDANARVAIEIIDEGGFSYERHESQLDDLGWMVKEWNTENLQRGTYYVMVSTNDERFTKRVVVK